MKGIVQLKVNLVPFKMIGLGECFMLNQKSCMRVSMRDMVASNRFVCLDDGIIGSIDLDAKVTPMVGSYTLLEVDLEEEDDI